jgi:integrase
VAFGTGLRMSELFGLKWVDIDFHKSEISVTRSIVLQVVGSCKTEASQKPIPLDSRLAEALKAWRGHTKYSQPMIGSSPVQQREGNDHIGATASCER